MLIERMTREMKGMRDDFSRQLGDIGGKVDRLQEANERKYVTQAEFGLWKWAIGLLVGVALTGVATLLLAKVSG